MRLFGAANYCRSIISLWRKQLKHSHCYNFQTGGNQMVKQLTPVPSISARTMYTSRILSVIPMVRIFKSADVSLSNHTRTFSSRKHYTFCELKDEDLEEMFVRGSGPGGQSVNQTANCVVIKHKPTGIIVKCHESRSLQTNRLRAREKLQEKIDFHLHGSNSFLAQQEAEASLSKKKKKTKNKLRLEMKRGFKNREGLE